jgi:N-acylneuraminate cytidylyltransferase
MALFVAIIPARGGSKGVKDKNLRPVADRPLVAHSIEAALNSRYIEDIFISTDSGEIRKVSEGYPGVNIIDRPAELATDASPTEDALLHALDVIEGDYVIRPDYVVVLQPTSPHRKPGSVDRCIETLLESGADSLLSVCRSHSFFWKIGGSNPMALYDYKNRPRRQDIPPEDVHYRENGSVYITKTEILRNEKNRLGGRIALCEMSEEESIEVDSLYELMLLDIIMRQDGSGNE